MTTQELINYYANLLIIQYRGKPKAYATIQTLVEPVIMDQLPISVQAAFEISTAVGDQLDVIGKYVGASRNGYDFSGPVTLNDANYRTLIGLKITLNSMGSSLETIQDFIDTNFSGQIEVYDFTNMTMEYYVPGTNLLTEFFVKAGFLPRPMAVGLRATIKPPVPANYYFGCTDYNNYPGAPTTWHRNPLNNYDTYNTSWPFLTYEHEITI